MTDANTAAASFEVARDKAAAAALRYIAAILEGDAPDALAYAGERFQIAARDLTAATDALPADRQPVGWAS